MALSKETPQTLAEVTTFIFSLCSFGNSGTVYPRDFGLRPTGAAPAQPPTCLLGDAAPGRV